MIKKEHLKLIGARIKSELNDLKRTPESAAEELGIEPSKVNDILNGNCDINEVYTFISKMGNFYPIDSTDLYIPLDDCINGIRIMRTHESKKSSRIFDRKDKTGARTPYYEYRDTAMSKASPFKSEWIKELRIVNNSDPENPDVAYNNGHFLHQTTFFIGPVNFYWEVNGKKYSAEMNTGDSNYITPFHPHSFSSRDANEDALIIAVTFGGDARRAQKELYVLGKERIEKSTIDYRNHNRAISQLVKQHMKNEKVSVANLEGILKSKNLPLSTNLTSLLDESYAIPASDIKILANALNIEVNDLMIPEYKQEEEVVIKHKNENQSYIYPNNDNPLYKIYPLARTSKMPLMKGFDMEILSKEITMNNHFESLLHSYVYNYGKSSVKFNWELDNKMYEEVLHPGDSMYIQPLIKHAFSNSNEENSKLLVIGVSGAINLLVQKELSYFPDIRRVGHETKRWFD